MSTPILVWLILCAIWGSTWLFIKLGLQDLPPLTFAGLRFLIAGLILVSIIAFRKIALPRDRRDWQVILFTGFFSGAVNYGLVFWGEQYISSGLAALLHATIPLFGMLFAHQYLPAERITLAKISGVFLGLIGLALIFFNQIILPSRLALWATAGILFGAVAVAYSNVMIKVRGHRIEPITLAAGQMCVAFPLLLTTGIALEGNPLLFTWTPLALLSLFYLALIGSCVAFILYFWLIKQIAVTKTMLILLVTPLIAIALGISLNGEEITWRILAGAACIISGIGAVLFTKTK